MDISDIISPLNDAQRKAVISETKHSLVLAGAGSGKTRVLIHRIAYVLQTENINPWNILAVTFTNKAAKEMQARLNQWLVDVNNLWIGTFHSLAHRFLRRHWQEAGLIQSFQILDSQDQLRIIKRVLINLNLDDKRWPPKQIQWQINAWKDLGLRPQNVYADNNSYIKTVNQVYQNYEQQNKSAGVVDFADLLLFTYETMRDKKEILEHYQKQFKHILVDEFQDTNTIQYKWIKLLVSEDSKLFVVGDDDQSIYGWRGAKIGNILDFSKDFKDSQDFKLEQNYRSTSNILNAANGIIQNNSGRFNKTLWTESKEGSKIKLYQAYNDFDEAEYIVNSITALQKENFSRNQIAILYRSNAQSRLFEEQLFRKKIPYRVYGGLRFFERAEIKDALAYLRLIVNSNDDVAFERVVNRPTRGIGMATIESIRNLARSENCPMWQASGKLISQQSLSARASNSLNSFLLLISMLKTDVVDLSLEKKAQMILDRSGLFQLYQQEKGKDKGEAKYENLKEFVSACEQFAKENTSENSQDTSQNVLEDFLSQSALDSGDAQGDEWDECVQLMTLHSAKGLEFPVVFLTGLEEGLFPHYNASDDENKLSEERRLCYVGVTRAEEILYLSFANNRMVFGSSKIQRPSRFVNEIPKDLIEEIRIGNFAKSQNSFNIKPKTNSFSNEFFELGQQVLHQKFGVGIVINSEGSGDNLRLEINFSGVGKKWLIVSYANLTKI